MDDRRIKTKIICTIGPETGSFEMLQRMAGAGMNIVIHLGLGKIFSKDKESLYNFNF